MATLSKIKPGQTLFDCRKSTGWNGVWPLIVEEVHKDYAILRSSVLDQQKKYTPLMLKRLRVTDPNSKKTK